MQVLVASHVDFILVGGVAAAAHGSARATYDVDVLYARDSANIKRIVAALAPLQPYLRGAPAGLPFSWNTATLTAGLNFTLTTTIGDIDLLGEMTYGGSYEKFLPGSEIIEVFDIRCRCLSLDQLIAAKRAAGRRKDKDAIAELEIIREEGARPPSG
ncbi:MAG: hypothetical protein AB7P99_10305 [Vicinamibacterales bacterium]